MPAIPVQRDANDPPPRLARRVRRIVRSLVTACDGDGGGIVIVSAVDRGYRRTAAFRCDLREGIGDVVGEVEEEHAGAGRLIDEWVHHADRDYALDVPDLAVRLLMGVQPLGGPLIPDPVRSWLDATIGPEFSAPGRALALPPPDLAALPDAEMATRANLVLDACPGWLDRSQLTRELAEEIALRERDADADPVRDAGAYRYLFEHRLIGHLEVYARMLLWTGWVWHAAGRVELSRSAFALASELADEQFAVPSHPFTVALTTRSLRAARAESGRSRRTGPRA